MPAGIYKHSRIDRAAGETNFDIFSAVLRREGILLDCAAPTVGHCYLALELTRGRGVLALVARSHWQPRLFPNFSYEIHTEAAGARIAARCPARILRVLTPLEEMDCLTEYEQRVAGRWRARCFAHLERRASNPRVREGDWVSFPAPIKIRRGPDLRPMQFVEGSTFRSHVTGELVVIHNWRDRDYQVMPEGSVTGGDPTSVSALEDLLGAAIDLGPSA